MNSIYNYKAFGLKIQSEFEIPEFILSSDKPEVFVRVGKAPEKLQNTNKGGVRYQSTKNEFLLEIDHIAKFYVKNGNEIIVEPKKGVVDKEVRLFLLGSAMGALFIQRGLLPIHGSTIKSGDSATIFSGQSGVGKSSIAAYFSQNGFKILADDISVVNNDLNVVPGFPKMKVWKDIIEKLGVKSDSLTTIRDSIKKYHLSIEKDFLYHELELERIIIIQSRNTPEFECEEIFGMKKFNAIKNNTYRYRFVEGLEKKQDHFIILNKLLPKIKVYKVSRPQSPIMLEELANFLIKTFKLNV